MTKTFGTTFAAITFLVMLALSLSLKFRAGNLEDQAGNEWKTGITAPVVTELLDRSGLTVESTDGVSVAETNINNCHVTVYSTDPQGQFLGILGERAADADRLTFYFDGKITPKFPYFFTQFKHIRYILLRTIGISPVYVPPLALIEYGECHELDKLRG